MSLLRRNRGIVAASSPVPSGGGGYVDEVTADSPTHYWRLEETSGATVADETGGADATVNGADLTAAGKVGSAASFDGVDDYLDPGVLGTFGSQITSGMTVVTWVKTTTTAVESICGTFNNGTGTTSFDLTLVGDTQRVRLFLRDDSNRFTNRSVPAASVFDGAWHRIAVALDDGANWRFYIDRDEVASTLDSSMGTPTAPANFDHPLVWGARDVRGTVGQFLTGDLDELALFLTALSQDRLEAQYDAATP